MQRDERPAPRELLAELGLSARLTVYLASAPGAGKTRRLLTDAALEAKAGRRVAIGWIETKGRPELDALAAALPKIPTRHTGDGGATLVEFDLNAALESDAELIVLDELAHTNAPGSVNAKRWQDALSLRRAGRSVLGAFNIQHLESVAPAAERIIGYPIREIVPLSFLKQADSVVALDVSPELLESRLRVGRIVAAEDVDRAAGAVFRPSTLTSLRQLLLRTIDDLTVPVLSPSKVSTALAVVTAEIDAAVFLRRVTALADALDLALETTALGAVDQATFGRAATEADAYRIALPPGIARGRLDAVMASLIAVSSGDLALRLLGRPLDRLLYVAEAQRAPLAPGLRSHERLNGDTHGRQARVGRLSLFVGSVAGSGKTYAMLDRAHQLRDEGMDVVAALIETHGRADTIAKAAGIETVPRLANGELNLEALMQRHPQVALIDELAHTNAGEVAHAKRYDDVLQVLEAGIDVMSTLNVQHLDGPAEAVARLTGTLVRERLPHEIFERADELVFVDVTPQILRDRLRAGKIYPPERVDTALANFFRVENLTALRELAVREVAQALRTRRGALSFDRIVLGVSPRARDVELIERMGPLALRLGVSLYVVTVVTPGSADAALESLADATARQHGEFSAERAEDAAARLVSLSGRNDALAVESPRRPRRLFSPRSFAARLVEAGARELLVLPPKG